MMCKASAYYYVTYNAAKEGSSQGITFPWNTCYDYLNRLKCDSEYRSKKTKQIPLSILK
jgi:hypothetical protein